MEATKNKPKVSACVVTYNQKTYIRQCLQSIVDQETDFDFEVIVGDDCSTDGTRAIVQEFAEKYPKVVKPILNERNLGSTINYLSVHSAAVGEYVAHMDGDDYWLPNKLHTQVKFMDENPDVVQTWHRQFIVNQESHTIGVFPKRYLGKIFSKRLVFMDLAHSYGLVGQHSSQMYRKTARSIYERDCETIDYFFALDIASNGYSLQLPEFLGCYRVVAGNSITQSATGRDIVDICVIDAARFFSGKYPSSMQAFKAHLLVRALVAYIKKRKHWRKMFVHVQNYPFSLISLVRSLFIYALHKI